MERPRLCQNHCSSQTQANQNSTAAAEIVLWWSPISMERLASKQYRVLSPWVDSDDDSIYVTLSSKGAALGLWILTCKEENLFFFWWKVAHRYFLFNWGKNMCTSTYLSIHVWPPADKTPSWSFLWLFQQVLSPSKTTCSILTTIFFLFRNCFTYL